MPNRKAIELSLNFIVIIIISIVLFGFGISFISRLSSQATELQELTISELDEKIGNLICEGSDRVCVGIDRKTITRKKLDVFGIKIINILDSQNFDVIISRPAPPGYKKNNQEIQSDNLKWSPRTRSIFIEKNEEKVIGVGIEIPPDAVPGTYIFDVKILSQNGQSYSALQKLYVDVPN